MREHATKTRDAEDRGQSALIAVVLLIGLVAVGSVGILLLGAQATDQSQQNSERERVEQAFLQLDKEVDTVARTEQSKRRVNLELPDRGDAAIREDGTGRIWVNRTNFTTDTTDVLVNKRVGAIRYTNDEGTTYAYQAGGLWREKGRQTIMLSPPAFSYRFNKSSQEPTLTVPIVVTDGQRRLEGGEVTIEKSKTVSPLNDVTVVKNDLVTVRVKSEWYVGWAKYFRQLTGDEGVSVDHANETATMRLIVPAKTPSVANGVFASGTGTGITLEQYAATDSYTSADGDGYAGDPHGDGSVLSMGDVNMQQDSRIFGDLVAGGDVDFQNANSTVVGNFSNESSNTVSFFNSPGSHVTGWQNTNASVPRRSAVDGTIALQLARAQKSNDNADHSTAITNLEDTSSGACSSTCTLTSGTYLLDRLHLQGSGDTLRLDTSGGPINIVIDGKMQVKGNNQKFIEITGPNRVNVYVNSSTAVKDVFLKATDVDVPRDDASLFWIYMDQDAQALLKPGSADTDFVGVLYGPGRSGTPGAEIKLKGDSDVFGAVVGDVDSIKQETDVHYDRSLRNAETVTAATGVPKLTFLHVSVYEVKIEDE